MKKLIVKFSICLLFVATIILGFNNNTVEASDIEISVNNDKLKFQESLESPYLDSNSRMMIPLRTISEELGHKVEWIQDIKTIAIDNNIYISIPDDDIYILIEDASIFIKNLGKTIEMDTEAKLKNGKTYVPARYIVEALGHELEYEYSNGNHKINILKNQGTIGNTTTQGKESYSGYIENIDFKKDQITLKKAEMLFDSDLNIFPELNLTMEDLPGGFYIAKSNNKETFKLTDSTKYNIIYNNNIMGEDVTKYQFLNVFNNDSMYTGYFIIETKNNYIKSIREIYHP